MRCGVIVFPGSNGDHDVYHILKHLLDQEVLFLWHGDDSLRDCELVVLPGGFAFGDYLRPGALAAHSPIMDAVAEHAASGGLVLGIGNGFQILQAAGLLTGTMRRNPSLRFESGHAQVRVERSDLPFTSEYRKGQILRLPLAYSQGTYVDSAIGLEALETEGRVVFRYVPPPGNRTRNHPWVQGIAGVCNGAGNVLGLMFHPERCAEEILGSADGLALFASAVEAAGESRG